MGATNPSMLKSQRSSTNLSARTGMYSLAIGGVRITVNAVVVAYKRGVENISDDKEKQVN